MIIDAFRFQGEDPRPDLVDALVRQVTSESNGDPSIMQHGYVDVNTGGNEAVGLLQFAKSTWPSYRDPRLPDDRRDPWANLNAGVRYFRDRHHYDTSYVGQGHGWKEGGVLPLNLPAALFDNGGMLPHGTVAVNQSGKPEPVFTHEQWGVLSNGFVQLGKLIPAIQDWAMVQARQVKAFEDWSARVANPYTLEGAGARAAAGRLGDIAGMLGGENIQKVTSKLLSAEEGLLRSREEQEGRLAGIAEKEKALAEARKALDGLNSDSDESQKAEREKIKKAEEELAEARKGSDADAIAKAESNLNDVRSEAEKKRAEDVEKSTEAVSQAEADLAQARLESVRKLDFPLHDVIPALDDAFKNASKLASDNGLGGVAHQMAGLAALTGPAGISVGLALDYLQTAIDLVKFFVDLIREFIERIDKARLAARQAVAEMWESIAAYAQLTFELQRNVASLQQSLVRGLNEQRDAEFKLRVAQQDRLVAAAEGELAVAEARLKLDEEIKRSALAAQLNLIGLREDWDTYQSYAAMEAQGVLEKWSDAAINALFTYEAARAKALQGELQARLGQIRAEAELAEAARRNARNQQDLLVAQERLIRMSAKVAGVDLVEAQGGAQVTKLLKELFEAERTLEKNVLGRWGYQLKANGSHAIEYRGQLEKRNSIQQALGAVMSESGVDLDDVDLNHLFKLMGKVAWRGGDPMDVLRTEIPKLADAETALRINEALKPIFDAKDSKTEADRKVEDLRADLDLYEKTAPLEETIKGLEYAIKGLEHSANAFAKGNEDIRGDYLNAAKKNSDAASKFGVGWELDKKYASQGVRDQIRSEYTIHMDGRDVYTAAEVDELLKRVTSGSNVRVRTVVSASDVAARRKELI